jgi:hypothetical protein
MSRYCEDCGADISHKGNRAKRCDEDQRAFHAGREKDRYSRVKDAISSRRILHRQGAADYEPAEVLKVVNYTHGGSPKPSLAPPRPGQHWTHDQVTRVQRLHAMASAGDDELPDQSTWDEVATRQRDNRVMFPAADTGPDRGFRGGREVPPISNYAAAGMLHRPSGRAGQRALQDHNSDRFGGRVTPPPAIHSGQLSSSMPSLQAAEQQAQAEAGARQQHLRDQARFLLPGRR